MKVGNDLGTYMIQSDYTSSVNMAIHGVSKRFFNPQTAL